MSKTSNFNAEVIKEFRSNKGRVGGFFADKDLLILHTQGARSRLPRIHPLVYMRDGESLFVIASAAGSPRHPAWFHNIVAAPLVKVEVGTEEFKARAKVISEPKRSILYEKAAASYRFFQDYAAKTESVRTIPVISLERLRLTAEY